MLLLGALDKSCTIGWTSYVARLPELHFDSIYAEQHHKACSYGYSIDRIADVYAAVSTVSRARAIATLRERRFELAAACRDCNSHFKRKKLRLVGMERYTPPLSHAALQSAMLYCLHSDLETRQSLQVVDSILHEIRSKRNCSAANATAPRSDHTKGS